jgi:hypothetical protein
MTVSSIFDMRFSPEAAEEGFNLSLAIGADMTATAGCTGYDVIRDVADPGHVMIATRWNAPAPKGKPCSPPTSVIRRSLASPNCLARFPLGSSAHAPTSRDQVSASGGLRSKAGDRHDCAAPASSPPAGAAQSFIGGA